jgi:hypothetical protein
MSSPTDITAALAAATGTTLNIQDLDNPKKNFSNKSKRVKNQLRQEYSEHSRTGSLLQHPYLQQSV